MDGIITMMIGLALIATGIGFGMAEYRVDKLEKRIELLEGGK